MSAPPPMPVSPTMKPDAGAGERMSQSMCMTTPPGCAGGRPAVPGQMVGKLGKAGPVKCADTSGGSEPPIHLFRARVGNA